MMDSVANLDRYLSRLRPSLLKEREISFNMIDLATIPPDQIYSELMFPVSLAETKSAVFHNMIPIDSRVLEPGTTLWRGRKLAPDDHIVPLREMRTVADAWEPPAANVNSAGRLNKLGESLLYTTYGDPSAVPDEIRVADDEWFSLIKYKVVKRTTLTGIGLSPSTEHLSAAAAAGANAVAGYFQRQYSRKIRTSDGSQYALSELIAKYNFDLPPDVHHGWIYRSVEHSHSLNITFRPPEAHLRLELAGVCICKADRTAEQTMFKAVAFSSSIPSNEQFQWHSYDSPLQHKYFPEFSDS